MSQVDYFLKLTGVDGESTDSKHKGEIAVESWSWGQTQSGSAGSSGGRGAGKVQMQDFHFVMKTNKASPKLLLACAQGEHIKEALLTCRKAGKEQVEFLKIKLSDVLVSSYQTGGATGGSVIPTDQISLNFGKVEYEYKPQKPDGSLDGPVKAGYDVTKNAKV